MTTKPKRGRPKVGPREQLNIRLREGEKEVLRKKADAAQRTLSDWARLVLLRAPDRAGE